MFFVLLGELTGAALGGKLLPRGRRLTFIVGNILVIISALIKQVIMYPFYCTGCYVCFVGAGFIQVAAPRYIEEIVPINRYGLFMGINMMIQNIAIFIGELQAIMLPERNEL